MLKWKYIKRRTEKKKIEGGCISREGEVTLKFNFPVQALCNYVSTVRTVPPITFKPTLKDLSRQRAPNHTSKLPTVSNNIYKASLGYISQKYKQLVIGNNNFYSLHYLFLLHYLFEKTRVATDYSRRNPYDLY